MNFIVISITKLMVMFNELEMIFVHYGSGNTV